MLDKKILELKDQMIRSVQESIRIESVQGPRKEGMPFGEGPSRALQNALDLSKSLGFQTRDLNHMIGYAEYGTGPEMVAVLGHLDVVPAGDGWTYPPFGGEIHDGRIYGRGATDDKGPTIAALYALKAIQELNLPLKRRVRILFGTNEETGSAGAKYYAAHEETPVAGFTPDAEYPIINGEKGIVNYELVKEFPEEPSRVSLKSIRGGTAPNVVPSYAEAVVAADRGVRESVRKFAQNNDRIKIEDGEDLKIKAFGKPAHGSVPQEGINAIFILIDFLLNLDLKQSLKQFLKILSGWFRDDVYGEHLGISMSDDISGKLTVNFGVMEGDGHKVRLKWNLRYPVRKNFEEFQPALERQFQQAGIEIASMTHKKSLYIDPNSELIQKLRRVYTQKTGKEGKLLSIGGGTYAKMVRNIVAFGPVFEGEPALDHQPDEYISVEDLVKNAQIMAAAIYELAK